MWFLSNAEFSAAPEVALYWPGSPVPLHSIICRQAGEISAVPWRPILVLPLGLKLNQSVLLCTNALETFASLSPVTMW